MARHHPTIRLLGSLKLAISILVFLAALLAVATWIEGQHGTRNANLWIYKTAWFDSVLGLVFINIFFATWVRYPFRKDQTGFVFTHAGILIILLGALLTRKVGQEGMLSLFEGEQGNAIVQEGTILTVSSSGQKLMEVDTDHYEDRDVLEKFNLGGTGHTFELRQVSAHSEISHAYEESKVGIRNQPAIQFDLKGSMSNLDGVWLSTFNPEVSNPHTMDLGVASISLVNGSEEDLVNLSKTEVENLGEIIVTSFDSSQELTRVKVKTLQKQELKLDDGTTLKLMDFFPYATVVDNSLLNDPRERFVNPAVRISATFPDGISDSFLRFQNIPDFKSSREVSQRINIALLDCKPVSKKARLTVLHDHGQFYYVSRSAKETVTGTLALQQSVATGWMDFQFTAKVLLSHSRPKKVVRHVPKDPQMKSVRPAVRIALVENGQQLQEDSIQYGESRTWQAGEKTLEIQYGPRLLYLPFAVHLKDFRKIDYPGTARAMSYESDVTVVDPEHAPSRFEQTIRMNEILIHRDWKFYQADFEILEDGREISRLQVGYDPGTPLIYFGSILMVIGICLMFWMTPKPKSLATEETL